MSENELYVFDALFFSVPVLDFGGYVCLGLPVRGQHDKRADNTFFGCLPSRELQA